MGQGQACGVQACEGRMTLCISRLTAWCKPNSPRGWRRRVGLETVVVESACVLIEDVSWQLRHGLQRHHVHLQDCAACFHCIS